MTTCIIQGVILNYFVPPKTTVNYYATVIKSELSSAIRRKQPQLQRSEILLHHDNAPSHSSHVVMDTVIDLDTKPLPHSPYSPELTICHFWLFPNLKIRLHGQKYKNLEEMRCGENRILGEYLLTSSLPGFENAC